MSVVRVCFLGTPDFAVTSLDALVKDPHFKVVGVVTQPDRPSGRKMQLQPTPVKVYCQNHKIPVISPDSVNTELILQQIEVWGAEVAAVVAFGQLLSEKFLRIFPLGAVNVHGSLLPRWRGAAPIQRSIEAGDEWTGVCLQKIVKKLDAGDVLGERKLKIESRDAKQLHDDLAKLGADLLQVELMDYVRGNLSGVPQDESLVTYAKKIDKSEAQIDWQNSARQIHNKIRAFVMGPGTWTTYAGKKVKIHKAQPIDDKSSRPPGTIVSLAEDNCVVATGMGLLEILEVQPESRNRMPITEFIKGYNLALGERFG